eukprot:TRINITY_DN962_c0_g1_i3.p1 TRINITY_DN962_c0_g1~~TRINITY_DN962_c0_g1_i3.p1  ORF type:complete len:346 (+),score=24.49 TRINITY_DN962_c0_g1_i3:91-1038(+)
MLSALTFSLHGQTFVFFWVSLTRSLAMVIDAEAEDHAGGVLSGFSDYGMAAAAAELAHAVYSYGEVPGWTLIDKIESGTLMDKIQNGEDQVGLYQAGSTCVVSFAGTNDPYDWMDNLDIRTTHKCGVDLHLGFYDSLLKTLQKNDWKRLVNVLRGPTCKSVVLTGHSLGGAMASILAVCANQNDGLQASFPWFPAFTVDKLYTIGAPGISKQPSYNAYGRRGCFYGTRSVNWDWGSFDPVPFVAHTFGFLHPPLEVTRLKEEKSWWGRRTLKTESYSCTSSEALTYPSVKHWWSIPLVSKHARPLYIQRLRELVR